ncbi:hypothetical protein TNCV_5041921 [Trichonephila clavipes]|nr:hypothetical protein TNCV_5041921 [Trichonephila clavipes]
MTPISPQLANKGHTKKSPFGLGSGKCSQHLSPPENRRASRKRPVQYEFHVDASGDSRAQWSDETRQLLYV